MRQELADQLSPDVVGSVEAIKRSERCIHSWVIESPNGATSRGVCKKCYKTKRFPNGLEARTDPKYRKGLGGIGDLRHSREFDVD